MRSMNAPGSPSSPLQMTYLVSPGCLWTMRHFWPVGNPAPPRPRRPDCSMVVMMCFGRERHRTSDFGLRTSDFPPPRHRAQRRRTHRERDIHPGPAGRAGHSAPWRCGPGGRRTPAYRRHPGAQPKARSAADGAPSSTSKPSRTLVQSCDARRARPRGRKCRLHQLAGLGQRKPGIGHARLARHGDLDHRRPVAGPDTPDAFHRGFRPILRQALLQGMKDPVRSFRQAAGVEADFDLGARRYCEAGALTPGLAATALCRLARKSRMAPGTFSAVA